MDLVKCGKLSTILILAMTICHSAANAQPLNRQVSLTSFLNYTDYPTPEFFDNNNQAFYARLKLLDQVPDGGEVRIMTFNYDNGKATRLLAMHMCLAAKRGVKVYLLPDSKSGDQPGQPNAFDYTPDHKVNQEVYQMLANCGVEVRIYNHVPIDHLLFTETQTLPAPASNGFTSFVRDYISGYAGRSLDWVKMAADFKHVSDEFFDNQKELTHARAEEIRTGLELLVWNSLRAYAEGKTTAEQQMPIIEKSLRNLRVEKSFKDLKEDIRSGQVRRLLFGLFDRALAHPSLGAYYRQARMINRLNHRKLFLVSVGRRSCMLLGGRNLGDDYLQWKSVGAEWIDGDVLICSQHIKSGDADVFATAKHSFDELWFNRDLDDPYAIPPQQTIILPNYAFNYNYLLFPDVNGTPWGNPMWIVTPADPRTGNLLIPNYTAARLTPVAGLTRYAQTLPAPLVWQDEARVEGTAIADSFHWRVATSTWMRERDEIRVELTHAIDRETEQIYIETAYSEMSFDLRMHLEAALDRKVQVHIVTNGYYSSDANSKLIRLLMGRWTRKMIQKYPDVFKIEYSSVDYGHMIHFKGAAFKCQVESDRAYRLNLVGSHNFHDRSGYSDKEHALIWEQPPRQDCRDRSGKGGAVSAAGDLADFRAAFYQTRPTALKSFRCLADEMNYAMASGKLSQKEITNSLLIQTIIYQTDDSPEAKAAGAGKKNVLILKKDASGLPMVRDEDEVFSFLEDLTLSGLADVIGTLF